MRKEHITTVQLGKVLVNLNDEEIFLIHWLDMKRVEIAEDKHQFKVYKGLEEKGFTTQGEGEYSTRSHRDVVIMGDNTANAFFLTRKGEKLAKVLNKKGKDGKTEIDKQQEREAAYNEMILKEMET